MTTLPQIPRSAFVGDGTTTTFATGFGFELAGEVIVTVDGAAAAIGVDFDLVGLPASYLESGANVVFRPGAIPAAGAIVIVGRATPRDQPEAFGDQQAFSPEQVAATLDRLVRMIQEAYLQAGTGEQGPAGPAGTIVEIQVAGGMVQYRHAGDVDWVDLIALVDLTGPQGDPGVDGLDGVQIDDAATAPDTTWSSDKIIAALATLGALAFLNTINGGNWSGTDLAVADGGTGASSASAARTNLGLVINTDVQGYSANLTTFAAIAASANVQTLLGAADFAAFRTSLGLGALALLATINGSNWSGADLAVADGGTGASSASAARSNLGLVINTDVQAYAGRLADIAGITFAQGDVLYFNGTNLVALGAGTSGYFLKSNGAGANPAWAAASGGSGGWCITLKPQDNEPPTSNYATIDLRNNRPVLDFDTTTQEAAVWTFLLPPSYAGGGITVGILCALTSATSGTVGWDVAIERTDASSLDIDADSFASAQTVTAVTVPGTSGQVLYMTVAISSGANMDSLAAGELGRLKLRRDVANDTATGDAEVLAVYIKET